MKKFLFLICLFIAFQGCKNKPYDSFSEFPSEVNLTYQRIVVKEMSDPNRVMLLQDAVIILDDKADYYFHVLDRENYAYKGSFVRKGHGPSEEMMIQTIIKLSENKFFYKTLNHIKIIDFNVTLLDFTISRSIPVFVNDLIAAFMLNGKVYGWNQEAHEKEFIHYDGVEKMVDFGAEFPLPERKYSSKEQMRLFSAKNVTVKPDGQLFAATYNYLPLLRIFDATDGSVKKEIRLENRKPFPDYLINGNEADWEHVTQNYWFTTSSNSYIYALYTGKTFGESGYDRNGPGNALVDLSNEIHVFDWEGNPVKKIITDKKLFNFDVSTDDSILIAISKEDPDHLYIYQVK